jgi:hypothetical protein
MLALASVTRSSILALGAAVALTAAGAAFDGAHAQTKLTANYTISIARIPIGKIGWTADIGEASYATAGSGEASGLLSILASGKGTAATEGTVADGGLSPTRFSSDLTRDDDKAALSMAIERGTVTEVAGAAREPSETRVPLTEAHRRNVVDPLTALLIPAVAGDGITQAALASEASGQRGNSIEVRAHSASEDARERAGDTRPEPGSSARVALASEASGQRGNSVVRAHSASEDARERADDTRPEPGSSARVACERTLPIFDGHRRFDLKLAFKRTDKVKLDNRYAGPVAVCAVTFAPVAGHRSDSKLVKFLQDRDIELWLAPVAGTRLLAPVRLSISNMFGNLVVQASEFRTTGSSARASIDASARTD